MSIFDLSFFQLFCPVAIWLTLISFFTAICFAAKEGILRLRRLHQIPCSGCAFATGEYQLKCAVNPCSAYSEEAINCIDYERKQSPQRWKMPGFLRYAKIPKVFLIAISEFGKDYCTAKFSK